jgi:hypothetical protein
MSVVESIRKVLGGERDRSGTADANQSAKADQRKSDSDEGSEARTTNLFHCTPCSTTYVSDELESCSQCDAPVERVPTEQDLGLL